MRTPKSLRLAALCILLAASAGSTPAQSIRLPSRAPIAVPAPAPAAAAGPTAPSNLTLIEIGPTHIGLSWGQSTEDGDTIVMYKIERCQDAGCTTFANIGTSPSPTTNYRDATVAGGNYYRYYVIATDTHGHDSSPSNVLSGKTPKFNCFILPVRPGCVNFGNNQDNLNSFFQTNGSLSFFNQVKSIYNGASGSATVSADLATLNLPGGVQATASTNVQTGTSGVTNVSSGTVPTLSANGAGQATQNMLYGGTALVSELYPLVSRGGGTLGSPGGLGLLVDFIAKEGVDIQNFKSGANVNVSHPPFHGSAQMEGYVQLNSINVDPKSNIFVGALFLGGSYGYSYMSHAYAGDYGFGKNVGNGIGQVSFGILISNVARITVSRAFGPSQTYIDSTTMVQTTLNNFKAWSFGIAYQSPTPAK